jgi:hypothetical protein
MLFIINAPRWFTAMWAVIKTMVDPAVLHKIQILGPDFATELFKWVAPCNVPLEFGGTDQTPMGGSDEESALRELADRLNGGPGASYAVSLAARAAAEGEPGDGDGGELVASILAPFAWLAGAAGDDKANAPRGWAPSTDSIDDDAPPPPTSTLPPALASIVSEASHLPALDSHCDEEPSGTPVDKIAWWATAVASAFQDAFPLPASLPALLPEILPEPRPTLAATPPAWVSSLADTLRPSVVFRNPFAAVAVDESEEGAAVAAAATLSAPEVHLGFFRLQFLGIPEDVQTLPVPATEAKNVAPPEEASVLPRADASLPPPPVAPPLAPPQETESPPPPARPPPPPVAAPGASLLRPPPKLVAENLSPSEFEAMRSGKEPTTRALAKSLSPLRWRSSKKTAPAPTPLIKPARGARKK